MGGVFPELGPKRGNGQVPSLDQEWADPVDCFGMMHADPIDCTEADVPPALWPFVQDTAVRMGVNRSSVVLCCLVACAAVITDDWRVQPKRYDDQWTECPRLWGAIVGPPSIKKTPVITACTKPVERVEANARKEHQKDVDRYKKALTKWKEDGADDASKPRSPRCPRWLVESFTVEALQEVLRDDEEARYKAPAKKVLVRQDELAEGLANFDRYSTGRGGGDRGAYLRLYNGGYYAVDRVGRGSFAANWSGCLLGGIQPEPIQRIAQHAVDDGLLQRFLYDVPEPGPSGVDQAPNRGAIERYHRLIPALVNLRPAKDRGDPRAPVVFHADAHTHREDIITLADRMAHMPDVSRRLQAALGKWEGLFARLCLTFHLINLADDHASQQTGPPSDVIPDTTAQRVAGYMRRVLLPNLLRAEAVMFSTAQTSHAQWIAGYILAHNMNRVTTRDIRRAYGALRPPEATDELRSVMASLATFEWVDPEQPQNELRPVHAWRVNPKVHALFAGRADQERQARNERQTEIIRRRQEHTNVRN